MKSIFKDTGIVLFVCLLLSLFVAVFTPYPAAGVIHQVFSNGGPAKEPTNYLEVNQKIDVQKYLSYPSSAGNNHYDLILPKTTGKHPVIFWLHGGAYVGGQKEDVSIYTNMLAAEGFAVVNIEYDLAPRTRYPGPLTQLAEVYREIQLKATDYSLDLENVVFGGDSAGGQIVAQFINIQVNEEYAQAAGFARTVDPASIKSAIFFCAPFSLSEATKPLRELPLLKFFVKRIGWAYTGNPDWFESTIIQEADMLTHITGNFPRSFITDAHNFSFEDQGKALAKLLKSQGTEVITAFYDSQEELDHEYQFDMTLPASQATFEKVVEFLKPLK
ncbi:alpha/beta hydrolase [Vagococcus salmoninarum]|uniref:alpha/beta hydrolase n=1 Tax=Vagococcus salmoninarum TaxID=2739 RepID=UPI003F96080A